MSRKTTKSILSRDEICLLLNSDEPQNVELYGNLYSVLCDLQNIKAISLDQLPNADNKAKAALTYNKKVLIDTVIKEWYAESVSEEDSTKKVRCGLCNTPNKYLYYIRNRENNTVLNVGSHCITKFPGIEGYIEQKKQLSQIKKGHQIIFRRNKFYEKFPDCELFIVECEKYFQALPILLPYELYSKLNDTITRLRLIYATYVNYGKKPYESEMDSFELFQLAIDQYHKLKQRAEQHISKNQNNPLACRRQEIDWLIKNNKDNLLRTISENEGIYTINSLKYIWSIDYVKANKIIFAKNSSAEFKPRRYNGENIVFSFNKFGYHRPITFTVSIKDFMMNIGANCIINKDFTYNSQDILEISKIDRSINNLTSILDYVLKMMDELNCAFLIDYETEYLFLYRKGDGAVRRFSYYSFISAYKDYILSSDSRIQQYLFDLINTQKITNWITPDMQAKQGINDKIGMLYKEYKKMYDLKKQQKLSLQ